MVVHALARVYNGLVRRAVVSTEIYVQRVKADLKKYRELLVLLESGQMQLKAREGSDPWPDTTQERIAQIKRTIAIYETTLAGEEI
jgi:hypothetical protein